MSFDSETLQEKVDRIVVSAPSPRDAKLKALCYVLRHNVPHYEWVGFYLVDPDAPRELVLGPYEGAPTDHSRIPFGKGVCGQVAEKKETIIIQDVSQEENYLSCSLHVKSEIVVPILKEGTFVGELDIDSNELSPFTSWDRTFLERTCASLADLF